MTERPILPVRSAGTAKARFLIPAVVGFFAAIACVVVFHLGQVQRQAEAVRVVQRIESELARIANHLSHIESSLQPPIRGGSGSLPSRGDTLKPTTPPERGPPSLGEEGIAQVLASQERLREALERLTVQIQGMKAEGYSPPDSVPSSALEPEPPPPNLVVALTASPTSCGPGDGITVAWFASPSDEVDRWDWIGLYSPDSENTGYVSFQWTNGQPSGEVSFEAPEAPGQYEFRYLFKSGYANVERVSNPVLVLPR